MKAREIFKNVVNGKVIATNCGNIQLEYFKGKLQLRYSNRLIQRGVMFGYALSIVTKSISYEQI